MKKYFISILLLATFVAHGQKPKKTFDHTEFSKQVVLGIAYSMDGSYLDYNAQQYIIIKTGKTSSEISEMAANYKASCEKDLVEIRNQKLAIMVETVDVSVIQESPYKVADIIIHSTYDGKKIDLKLTNCIQTDRSWFLGDHITASGDGVSVPHVVTQYNQTTDTVQAIQTSETLETTTTTNENESSTTVEDPILPTEFQSLIGTWSISQVTVNGKEKSNIGYNGDFSFIAQYLDDEMWLGGNPREMTFHADGTLTYDDFFVQKREIVSSTWNLQTSENEDGSFSYTLWIEKITNNGTTGCIHTNFLIKDGVMTFQYIDADVKYLLKL